MKAGGEVLLSAFERNLIDPPLAEVFERDLKLETAVAKGV